VKKDYVKVENNEKREETNSNPVNEATVANVPVALDKPTTEPSGVTSNVVNEHKT